MNNTLNKIKELFNPQAIIHAEKKYEKYFVELKESKTPECAFTISGFREKPLVVNLDDNFPEPKGLLNCSYKLNNQESGICKRADFAIFTKNLQFLEDYKYNFVFVKKIASSGSHSASKWSTKIYDLPKTAPTTLNVIAHQKLIQFNQLVADPS